jgi:HK97 gp10 family phage protein
MSNGLDRLNRRFRALPKNVQAACKKALDKNGKELVDKMQGYAPVDTGKLKESIVATPGGQQTPPYSQPGGSRMVPDNAVVVTAGNTDVRYPHLVEYGTANAEAQPFFWPAYRLLKQRMAGRITRAARKAIREGRSNV